MAESIIKRDAGHGSYSSIYTNKKTYVYYKNGVVTLSIRELKGIPSGMTNLFTLPIEYVNTDYPFYMDTYSNGQTFRFIVDTNGAVSVYNYGSAISGVDNSCFLITYVTS